MFWLVLLVICIVTIVKLVNKSKETIDVQGKSIFISGCDTGFGHGLAVRMDKLGMRVFAGCITDQGISELRKKCSPNIRPIICDITQSDQIQNAVSIVSDACPEGLWALVNNAGIAVGGEWDWSSDKNLRRVMEVNFFGHVAVTMAMLPLLKKTKGRILNLTSIAGVVAFSRLGAYSCSKFAMEAFSDSLRRELRKWGISIYIIEPGFTDTPMVAGFNDLLKQTWEETSVGTKLEYGDEYGKLATVMKLDRLDHPDLVINTLQQTLTRKFPVARKRVGPFSMAVHAAQLFLPTTWADWLLERENKNLIPAVVANSKKHLQDELCNKAHQH